MPPVGLRDYGKQSVRLLRMQASRIDLSMLASSVGIAMRPGDQIVLCWELDEKRRRGGGGEIVGGYPVELGDSAAPVA